MGARNIYERFVWFDDRVRSAKYPNATALSREFEVSLKTAQRDIEFMRCRLNCPLEYDRQRKGYYYRDGSFSLPMTYLSSEDLSSLLLAKRLLGDVSGSYIEGTLASVIKKLTSILSRHVEQAGELAESVSFKLIEYSPVPEGVFQAVLNACLKRRQLKFLYRSPAQDTHSTRTVSPWHLLNYMGTWHLIGYCHMRKDLRDFVLSRMSDVETLDKGFKVPKSFDVNRHLDSAFGIFKGEGTVDVTIRFTPERAKWVHGQIWFKGQKTRHLRDGSLELTFPVADFSEVMMEVLKHGSGVKVVRPKSLQALVVSEAKKILKNY